VVLTAWPHAGVVNTVMHAREVTGVDKVHAIIGSNRLGRTRCLPSMTEWR
jgi:metal-dependent hydrolase (beta-lactamase superfamily II)